MTVRTLSNNSSHQTALVNSLTNGDSHVIVNLVKFERANLKSINNFQRNERSVDDYIYLTDNSYEVSYDGNTYIPAKLLKIGQNGETIKAKATNMKLELDGSALGLRTPQGMAFAVAYDSQTSTEHGTLRRGPNANPPMNTGEHFNFIDEGFSIGDILKVERVAGGPTANVRITRFFDDGIGIGWSSVSFEGANTATTFAASGGKSFHSISMATESLTSLLHEKTSAFVNYLNREVYIYRAHINPETRQIIGEPFIYFKGIVTNGSIDENLTKSTVNWTLTSHWGDFLQVTGRITDDGAHRGLGPGGVTDTNALVREQYAGDLGFLHANSAFNIQVKYQTIEKGYKQVDINGGWPGGKRLRETETIRENSTVLDFHTNSKSIPVVYGVRKVKPTCVFVDTAYDSASTIFKVDVMSEGRIGGVYDVMLDDTPIICIDKSDYDLRNGGEYQHKYDEGEVEIVCHGHKTRGDVLEPTGGAEMKTIRSLVPGQSWRMVMYGLAKYENIQVPTGFLQNSDDQPGEALNATGILDEETFVWRFGSDILAEFKLGGPDQEASNRLLEQAASHPDENESGFKIGQQYYGTPWNYWGPSHRLLDTAYAAIEYKIPTGESTVPQLEYIIKGKSIECYNYDGSYGPRQYRLHNSSIIVDSANVAESLHDNFFEGKTVSLYALSNPTAAANTSSDTVLVSNTKIIDKFKDTDSVFFKRNIHRYRWETAPNLTGVETFYMTDGTNYYYMNNGTHTIVSGNVPESLGSGLLNDDTTYDVSTNTHNLTLANNSGEYQITGNNHTSKVWYVNLHASNSSLHSIQVWYGGGLAASYTGSDAPTKTTLADGNGDIYTRAQEQAATTQQKKYAVIPIGTTVYTDLPTTADRTALGDSRSRLEFFWVYPSAPTDKDSNHIHYSGVDYTQVTTLGVAADTLKIKGYTGFSASAPQDWHSVRVVNAVLLDSNASSVDGIYNNKTITLTKAFVDGSISQTRTIKHYDGTSKIAFVETPWETAFLEVGDNSGSWTGAGITSYAIKTPQDLRHSLNPSLQLLDYMSSERYGKGLSIANDVDLESFLDSARLCDERSDVTVVVPSNHGTRYSVGDRWSLRKTFSTAKNAWSGKVKAVSSTKYLKGIGHYKTVTFEECYGQICQYSGRGYESSDLLYYVNGDLYYGGNAFHFKNVNAAAGKTLIAKDSTSIALYKDGGDGTGTAAGYVMLSKAGVSGDGNPIIKDWDDANEDFRRSGYSLYDASQVKYWKYIGWEDKTQRYATRHQMNQVIDTSQPLFDNIIEMAQQFNAIISFTGGLYKLRIAGKKTAVDEVEQINTNDIIGGIKLNDGGLKGSKNYMSATIIDPHTNYEGRTVTFFDSEYLKQDKGLPKKGSTKLPGITNYFNARMQVEQSLRKSRYGLTVQFTLPPKGMLLTAGSIIELTHQPFDFNAKDFRITSLTFKQDGNVLVTAVEHSDDIYKISEPSSFDDIESGSIEPADTPKPLRPTNLKSVSDLNVTSIDLQWTNASDFLESSHSTEIWASYTNNFADSISSGSLIAGHKYRITNVGNTNFELIGAATNTVGTIFVANDTGTSGQTGTVSPVILIGTTSDNSFSYVPTGPGNSAGTFAVRYHWVRHVATQKLFNVSGSRKKFIKSDYFPKTTDSGHSSGEGVTSSARQRKTFVAKIVPTVKVFTYNEAGTAIETGNPSTSTLSVNTQGKAAQNSVLAYAWFKNGTSTGQTGSTFTYTAPSALSSMPETIKVEVTDSIYADVQTSVDIEVFSGTKVGDTGARGPGTWNVPVNAAPTNNTTADAAWDASWTDRPGDPVAGDQAYFYTGSEGSPTAQVVFIYNGSSWSQRTQVIDGDLLVSGSISTNKIAANAINTDKLAANTITTKHIEASSVVADLITANSIKTDTLAANAITVDKLAANTITTKHIKASSVVADLITANSVKTDTLAANAITVDKLAANTITTKHIKASSVVADLITANSVKTDTLAANAITVDKVAANAIQADQLAANSVVATSVAATSVVATLIDASAVTAGVIAANAITTDKISSNAVDADKINVNQLSAVSANMGSITAGTMKSSVTDPIPDANAAPSGDENGAFIDLNAGKFVFGDNAKYILWDGSDLTISGVSMSGVSIDNTSTIDAIAGIVIKEDSTQEAAAADTLDFTTGMNVGVSGDVATISVDTTTIATKSYVDTQVSGLVDSAPGALNTLNELAAALGDDAAFSTTVTNSLANKVGTSSSQALASTNPISISGTTLSLNLATGSADTVTLPDNNTTYTTSIPSATTKLRLTGSDTSTDDITFTGGTNVTVTRSGDSELSFSSVNTEYSTAASDTLGLVKIGYAENNKNYPVELSNGQMFVNVPWVNDNTQVTVDDSPVDGSTTAAISSNWAFDNVKTSVPASAVFTDTTFTVTVDETGGDNDDPAIRLDSTASGADTSIVLTGGGATTITRTSNSGITISSANTEYSTATSNTAGLVKIGYSESGKNYPVELDSGKMFVNVPWVNDNTQVTVHDTPVDGNTSAAISSNWAFDNVKTSVPANALFSDTEYTAGTGLSLGGTEFSIDSTVLTTTGAQTISGVKTHSANIELNNTKSLVLKHAGSGTNSKLFKAAGNATRLEYYDNSFVFDAKDNKSLQVRNSNDATHLTISPHSTLGSSAFNLNAGTFKMGGTTVFDASRNLTAANVTANNLTTTGYLRGPASFTIDPATHGDNTGTVIIAGDLQVDGTTTTINSTSIAVDDLNITVASGAADAASANGAGLTVDGANATYTYTSSDDSWNMNRDLRVLTTQGTGTFMVGRTADQSLDLHVTDTVNSITARQDSDENGNHYFRLNRVFQGSGTNEFAIQKDGTNQLSIDTNANATFAGNAYFPSGSSSAPGISFSADQDTGLSRAVEGDSDRLWLLTGGGVRGKIGTHGIESLANVYSATSSSFRNYAGTWQASTGTTGNGFQFVNSIDGTAMTISSTGNVNTTGDLTVAGGNVYLTDTNTDLSQGGASGQLKITTPTGWVSVGSENTSWTHIQTDRPKFYFNKGLSVNTGIIGSYDEDLTLSRANSTTNKVVLSTDKLQGYRDTTKLLQLGGFVLDTHSENVSDGVYIPGVSYNNIAGADKRLTVTSTKNGTSIDLGGEPFQSGASFGQTSTSNTDSVVITISNCGLTHSSHAGIQFGGANWRAKDVKIETSTDGSTFTERQNVTGSGLINHHVYFSTGGTNTSHVRYTLTNFAGTAVRINHLWAYNYNTNRSYWPDRFRNNAIYGDFDFKDTYKATFGNSEDLQIYHDGSNSFISDTGTGDLTISADNDLIFKDGSGNLMANMNASNSVELYFGNVKKFETTSGGVSVTGNITVSGTVDGRDVATDGTKLDTIDTNANNYTLPTATSGSLGGVKIGYTQNNKNYPVQLDSDKAYVSVPWSDNNTQYTAGALLDLSTTQFNVDLSELSTTTTLVNSDHIVVLDNGAQKKITPANIALTVFDATGFTAEADGGNATQLGGENASYYLNTSTTFGGDVSGTYNNLALGTQSDITMTGDLKGPQNFTIDPADANGDHGNNNGTVVIAGNLQVDGTTTTINSTTLDVDDLTITVAKGAADSAAANGAGLHIDGANESLIWDSSNGYFEFTDEVFSTEFITGTTSTKVGRMNNDSGVFNLQAYTAREISFGNDTNGEHVRIDATGNVGIGTTSPDEALHVEGSVLIDAYNQTAPAGIFFREGFSSGDANPYNLSITCYNDGDASPDALDISAYDGIYFHTQTGNARQVRGSVDTSGNWNFHNNTLFVDAGDDRVGIGTDDPSDELHVHAGSINVTPVTYAANANDYVLKYGASNNSGWDGMGLKLRADASGVPFTSFCAPSGTSVLNIKGSKVGIGTTAPTAPVTIKSSSTSASTSGLLLQGNSNTNTIVAIGEKSTDGGRFHMYDGGVEKIAFYTDGTDNHISSGNVGIGTTAPSAKLHVKGDTSDADDAKIAFRVEDSSGADLLRIRDAGEVIIPDNYLFVSASQGAYFTGSIRARGSITNDGGNELSISSGNTQINFNNKNLYNIKSLNVAGRKITKTPTSKSFFVGNNDWTELCVGGGTKTYSATHQGVNINSTGHSQIVPVQMPIDPEATYRVKVRVKQVTTTSGLGKFYAGVQTLNEDLTNLASDGANSYNYGLASSVQLTAGQTYTFENTFKGYNSVSGTNTNKFDPEGKYFNVVLITNYEGNGDTVIQSIEVQKVDENSSVGSSLGVGELDLRTTTTAVSSTSATVVDTFSKTAFRSAKYTVQITQGSNYQVSEVLVLHNGSTASATEFAKIETNGVLGTLQTAINGNNVELKVTMSSSSAATVKVARHSVTV